jgi:thioesterase domain-containing protein
MLDINSDLLRDTERFLHEQIPLTLAMGATVESYDAGQLVLSAPLAPNHDHLGTAFGGSLAALATLAGYALLWLQLGDRQAHIVIRESTMRYRRPVRGTLRAVCLRPDDATWAAFHSTFEAAGKAHIKLRVHIEHAEQTCVEFEGEFVAIR